MPHDFQSCAAQHIGPWMVEPKWFTSTVSAIRAGTIKPAAEKRQEEELYVNNGGLAIISIAGPITKGDSSFGGASSIRLRNAVRAAARSEDIDAILLYIDSPGGTVAGTAELAADVRAAAKVKTVHAHFSDLGASAAYWIGSQATTVSAEPTTMVGSIGTVAVVEDSSGAYEMAGIKVHVVSTGPYKGAFAEGSEVTEEQLADLRREINQLNEHFLRGVAQGRDMAMDKVREIATGQVWLADEAKSLGLIDAVASFDQVATQIKQRVHDMTNERIAEAIKEDPSLINTYTAQAKLHGEQEGVAAALAEFKSLLDAAGGDTKLAADSFLARQSVDVVKAVVADRQVQVAALAAKDAEIAELRKQAEAAKALADGQPAVAVAPETETPGDKYEGMSAQDRIAAEWDDNAGDCQKTFKNLYAYNAFRVSQMKNSKPVKA